MKAVKRDRSGVTRIGETWKTNEGYNIKITEYFDSRNCTIQFEDGFTIYKIKYSNIKGGRVSNPFHKSIYGIGYVGVGNYETVIEGKSSRFYQIWRNMLERCYCEKFLEKNRTYIGCTVFSDWHNFQSFAQWCEDNLEIHMIDWHLDKDLLIKGNKHYSPETCCFIPSEINTLFPRIKKENKDLPTGVSYCKNSNTFKVFISKNNKSFNIGQYNTPEEAFLVYKKEKESYIREIAIKWRKDIPNKVFESLIHYEI